jgi:hypothetical protein
MITTSFIILKYALTTGPFIVGSDYDKVECGTHDQKTHDLIPYDDNYLDYDWDASQKETLVLSKSSHLTFYHNNGLKYLEFVPNTPLGRGLAMNYITFKEQKKLDSMAKQLTTEGEPFAFPWGVGIKKAQDAKRFIEGMKQTTYGGPTDVC